MRCGEQGAETERMRLGAARRILHFNMQCTAGSGGIMHAPACPSSAHPCSTNARADACSMLAFLSALPLPAHPVGLAPARHQYHVAAAAVLLHGAGGKVLEIAQILGPIQP